MFTGGGDVLTFFVSFENVLMRGTGLAEKPFELLPFLDRAAFEFFFNKFTFNGDISEDGKCFDLVKRAFLERFPRKTKLKRLFVRIQMQCWIPRIFWPHWIASITCTFALNSTMRLNLGFFAVL